MSTSNTAASIRSIIDAELPELIRLRRDLHAHPELGYEEFRTSERIRSTLQEAGVKFVADLAGGTGVLGFLPGSGSQAIGLRADIDALPLEEQTELPHASTIPGRMHACGHDGHTTMLLGAAKVLATLARDGMLPHPVAFVFQPAEEGGGGGRRMVEDGCLDGSRIDWPVARMFGLHGWPRMPLGTIGTKPGPLLAAADRFELTVHGTGGHAAFPHQTRDPIIAATAIITAFQSIVSRNVDPVDAAVVSTTVFQAGSAFNIIAPSARLAGTVRTLQESTRVMVRERMHTVAEQVAAAHGCRAALEYIDGYPVTRNDEHAAATFFRVAGRTVGEDRTVQVPSPFMGSEDFSFYCEAVPSCFFLLGLKPEGVDAVPDLHQPTFDFNDDAIATGVEIFCRLALEGAAEDAA